MRQQLPIPDKPKAKADILVASVVIAVAGIALCGVGKMCLDDSKSPRIAGYGILIFGLAMVAAAIGIVVAAVTKRKRKLRCPECGNTNIAPLSEKERGERGFPSFTIAGYGKCSDCGHAWAISVPVWLRIVTVVFGLALTCCFFIGGYGGATLGLFGATVLFGCAKDFLNRSQHAGKNQNTQKLKRNNKDPNPKNENY